MKQEIEVNPNTTYLISKINLIQKLASKNKVLADFMKKQANLLYSQVQKLYDLQAKADKIISQVDNSKSKKQLPKLNELNSHISRIAGNISDQVDILDDCTRENEGKKNEN